MYLSDETYRDVIVAAIQAQGSHTDITSLIKETVDALIAADRKLVAFYAETTESHQKKA